MDALQTDPLTDQQRVELTQAWAHYQSVRRSVWVKAPHIERRFFHTQDRAQLTEDWRVLTNVIANADSRWRGAVRRAIHKDVYLQGLGAVDGDLMPGAYLITIPARGRKSLGVREVMWGDGERTREGNATAARLKAAKARERAQVLRAGRCQLLKVKMMASNAAAARAQHEYMRLQAVRRTLVQPVPKDGGEIVQTPERVESRKAIQRAYVLARHHKKQALKYQGLLQAEGLQYDLYTLPV